MSLKEQYILVRSGSANMCDPLEVEDYVPQPTEEVSPPKWNIAHTTWFFEELILKIYVDDYVEFNPSYSYLFNSYYEHAGKRVVRNQRGNLSRPTVKEILSYREYVDDAMIELIESNPSKEVKDLIILGLNHEQQHQELFFTDLKYTFSLNPMFPAYQRNNPPCEIIIDTPALFVKVDEGIHSIGYNGDAFCFDNELPRHKVFLHEFEIRNTLVTNGEYLDFIRDGGYNRHEFWHSDGWRWVQNNNVSHPLYWREIDGEWNQFTLAGLRKLDTNQTLSHVNYYEAAAFAEWKGMRLPTEFEWEAASKLFDWGDRWEWTESAYLPYPGFKKNEGAVGEYNGKFMVNQKVLRGGSVVTPEGHTRNTYRNFFHPHFSWQFTGIRLTKKQTNA